MEPHELEILDIIVNEHMRRKEERMISWTQQQAIDLCIQIEQFAPQYGCHVALTGGCLYKSGPRKDVDIMVYRIRQVERIDLAALVMRMCADLGVRAIELYGWVTKLHLADGRCIDLFDPACDDGTYPVNEVPVPSVDLNGSSIDKLGQKWQSDLSHFD